jgi:prolipoprotein diacylglyceryltransferase
MSALPPKADIRLRRNVPALIGSLLYFCPIAPFCSAVADYGAGRFLRENLREDENNGRDKAAMQATSLALMIAARVGLVLIRS